MKTRSTNRIYLPHNFLERRPIVLDGDTAHYIRNVLRLKVDNKIRIFNETLGEFLTKIIYCDKKEINLAIEDQIREGFSYPKLSIGPCLIKADRLAAMLDMAVQLGVAEIIPIISSRTVHRSIKQDRLIRIIIEAVEQSEQLSVPKLSESLDLASLDASKYDAIIYANEHEETGQMLESEVAKQDNILLITGPEGGFTNEELSRLKAMPNSYSVSLGENILRAETAMLKLISYVQFLKQA